MRVLFSTYGPHADVEPMVGLAVRPLVTGATPPSANLPRRVAELVAAQFDTLPAAAEGCDALVAKGLMRRAGGGELSRTRGDGFFAQDDTGVEVSDGGSLRAKYLVEGDGGRSLIRKKAGIDFPGWDPSTSYLRIHSFTRMRDGGPVRRCDNLSRTHRGGSG